MTSSRAMGAGSPAPIARAPGASEKTVAPGPQLSDFPTFDASTWAAYAGRTVAVRDGHVLAVADSTHEVWRALRVTPCPDPDDCDYIVWVPTQAATYTPRFSEWERGARDVHREFTRRLRG